MYIYITTALFTFMQSLPSSPSLSGILFLVSLLLHGGHDLPGVNKHQHVEALVHIGAVLDALPRRDARLVHVEIEDADLAVEAAVARVAAEAGAAGMAHPEGRLPLICL